MVYIISIPWKVHMKLKTALSLCIGFVKYNREDEISRNVHLTWTALGSLLPWRRALPGYGAVRWTFLYIRMLGDRPLVSCHATDVRITKQEMEGMRGHLCAHQFEDGSLNFYNCVFNMKTDP